VPIGQANALGAEERRCCGVRKGTQAIHAVWYRLGDRCWGVQVEDHLPGCVTFACDANGRPDRDRRGPDQRPDVVDGDLLVAFALDLELDHQAADRVAAGVEFPAEEITDVLGPGTLVKELLSGCHTVGRERGRPSVEGGEVEHGQLEGVAPPEALDQGLRVVVAEGVFDLRPVKDLARDAGDGGDHHGGQGGRQGAAEPFEDPPWRPSAAACRPGAWVGATVAFATLPGHGDLPAWFR